MGVDTDPDVPESESSVNICYSLKNKKIQNDVESRVLGSRGSLNRTSRSEYVSYYTSHSILHISGTVAFSFTHDSGDHPFLRE